MEKTFSTTTRAATSSVVDVLSDLGRYSQWLDVASDIRRADPDDGDLGQPAWWVTLTAKVGPFSRSKKLRMTRATFDRDSSPIEIRFERREIDGRDHAPWNMTAIVADQGDGTTSAKVTLYYGGSLWAGPLEPILDGVAASAVRKLNALLEAQA